MTDTDTIEPAVTEDDEPQLQAQLSEAWAISAWHLILLVLICLFFLTTSYMPLRGTDLWLHVNFGNWILENKALPTSEPFLPLADGMELNHAAWLSQVAFAAIDRLGTEWLSIAFAVTLTLTLLVLVRVYYLQSMSLPATIVATIAVLAVGWSRTATIRPENFAGLCMAILLWLVLPCASDRDATSEPSSWPAWVGIPLVMMLWANLHGSFVCGLAVLVCVVAGQYLESAWRERRLWAPFADPRFRRLTLISELACLATLVNPQGIELWWQTLVFSNNSNLSGVLEWQPMSLVGIGGLEFAISWLLLVVLARFSRRRFEVAPILMLLVFSVLAAKYVRMVSWYAPVYGVVIAPHLADLLARCRRPRATEESSTEEGPSIWNRRSWHLTLIGGLVIWMTFSFSPLSQPVLGGVPRTPEKLHDKLTPLRLALFLRDNPRDGQIYNPQYWGDWIVKQSLQTPSVFATSNIHMLPRQVWSDYRRIQAAGTDWQDILDRYRVKTVVLDRDNMPFLAGVLRRSSDWRRVYRDDQAEVYAAVETRDSDSPVRNSETPPPKAPADAGDEVGEKRGDDGEK